MYLIGFCRRFYNVKFIFAAVFRLPFELHENFVKSSDSRADVGRRRLALAPSTRRPRAEADEAVLGGVGRCTQRLSAARFALRPDGARVIRTARYGPARVRSATCLGPGTNLRVYPADSVDPIESQPHRAHPAMGGRAL